MVVAVCTAVGLVAAMVVNSSHDRGCAYTNACEDASACLGGEGASRRCPSPPLLLCCFQRATIAIIPDYRSQQLNKLLDTCSSAYTSVPFKFSTVGHRGRMCELEVLRELSTKGCITSTVESTAKYAFTCTGIT